MHTTEGTGKKLTLHVVGYDVTVEVNHRSLNAMWTQWDEQVTMGLVGIYGKPYEDDFRCWGLYVKAWPGNKQTNKYAGGLALREQNDPVLTDGMNLVNDLVFNELSGGNWHNVIKQATAVTVIANLLTHPLLRNVLRRIVANVHAEWVKRCAVYELTTGD